MIDLLPWYGWVLAYVVVGWVLLWLDELVDPSGADEGWRPGQFVPCCLIFIVLWPFLTAWEALEATGRAVRWALWRLHPAIVRLRGTTPLFTRLRFLLPPEPRGDR